jgi:hypothetical protein
MTTATQFREKAAECAESLKNTEVPSEVSGLQRAKDTFTTMADNEEWLAKNSDKVVHSQDARPAGDDDNASPTPKGPSDGAQVQ